MAVRVDLRGLRRAAEQAAQARKRVVDLGPVLKPAAALLDSLILESFERSRSPNGRVWPRLAPSTVARRRGGSSRPLVDTGQLRSSVNVRVDGNAIRFGVSGTAATYAPTHQFGARTGRNRAVFVPARPFLPLDATGGLRFDSGRARAWLDRTKRNIARYILTGKA